MRDKQYNLKSYRLNEKTVKNLEKIKEENNLSWNLIFRGLVQLKEKHGFPNINEQIKQKSRRTKEGRKNSIL